MGERQGLVGARSLRPEPAELPADSGHGVELDTLPWRAWGRSSSLHEQGSGPRLDGWDAIGHGGRRGIREG